MQLAERTLWPEVGSRYKRRIARAYFVRFQMSLIVAAVIASGVLTSKGLLELGVDSLTFRYPLAVLGSYLVFLVLIRIWIWYASIRSAEHIDVESLVDGADLIGQLNFGGRVPGESEAEILRFGGGDSGGAGASDCWDANVLATGAPQSVSPPAESSDGLPKLSVGIDFEDGGWILLLLAVLVVAMLGLGGYLVYAAPQILPEAAWQALLAGALARISREQRPQHWIIGVLRSTWVSFVTVFILATAMGWEFHRLCPSALRLVDIFRCVV